MSLATSFFLLETYGPRMGVETLAKVLGWSSHTVIARVAKKELEIPTYIDGKMRFADTRDVAEYLDKKRAEARQ